MSVTLANQVVVGKGNAAGAALPVVEQQGTLDAAWLHDLCLRAGADDVGLVPIDRPELVV